MAYDVILDRKWNHRATAYEYRAAIFLDANFNRLSSLVFDPVIPVVEPDAVWKGDLPARLFDAHHADKERVTDEEFVLAWSDVHQFSLP